MNGAFDASWSDVLPARPRPGLPAAWGLLALLNLAAGLVIASWPDRQSDLDSVRGWARLWLVDGSNVYATLDTLTDYPPHAIVTLSPLSLLPGSSVIPIWAAINLLFAVLAPYLALRVVRPRAPWSSLALPTYMFLCWGGTRTLLQFTLFTLVCALLAMRLADRRPVLSGVCLGLALIKPQIAAPFVLWALFTRRLRVVVIAMLTVAGGTALFCLRAQVGPVTVLRGYLDILGALYLLDEDLRMVGLAQLRPLILLAVRQIDLASVLAVALALVLLLAILIVGAIESRQPRELMMSAPPLAAVWSLLTFYHLTYGFLILLPVATLLIFDGNPATRTLRRTMFWIMQAALVVDVPGMWPRVAGLVSSSLPVLPSAMASHADRVLAAALFAGLLVVWGRSQRSAPQRNSRAASASIP